MNYVEGGTIEDLKTILMNYLDSPDDEKSITSVQAEFVKIHEVIETNKKIESKSKQHQQALLKLQEIKKKIDLDKHSDIIKEYCRVEQLRVGNILDAQDYLESWYLAIVLEEKNESQR